jgi:hypothetical protein
VGTLWYLQRFLQCIKLSYLNLPPLLLFPHHLPFLPDFWNSFNRYPYISHFSWDVRNMPPCLTICWDGVLMIFFQALLPATIRPFSVTQVVRIIGENHLCLCYLAYFWYFYSVSVEHKFHFIYSVKVVNNINLLVNFQTNLLFLE